MSRWNGARPLRALKGGAWTNTRWAAPVEYADNRPLATHRRAIGLRLARRTP